MESKLRDSRAKCSAAAAVVVAVAVGAVAVAVAVVVASVLPTVVECARLPLWRQAAADAQS